DRVGARYRSITEGPLARSFSDGSENPRRSARSTKTDRRVSCREETSKSARITPRAEGDRRAGISAPLGNKVTTREPADWGRHHPPAIRAPSKPQFRFDRPGCSDGNVGAAVGGRNILRSPRHRRVGANGAQRLAAIVEGDDACAAYPIEYLVQPVNLSAERTGQIRWLLLRPSKAVQRRSF